VAVVAAATRCRRRNRRIVVLPRRKVPSGPLCLGVAEGTMPSGALPCGGGLTVAFWARTLVAAGQFKPRGLVARQLAQLAEVDDGVIVQRTR